jgi:polynucleotide 5'-kinase involved in rRNA processing
MEFNSSWTTYVNIGPTRVGEMVHKNTVVEPDGEDVEMVSNSDSSMESEDRFEEHFSDSPFKSTDDSRITRPFDMHLLRQSLDDGTAVLQYLEGQQVVFVIGKTGTGKSTFIVSRNFLQ